MKIGIISDTHDNVPNLEKTIAWMNSNGIDEIIHCGDLCAPSILKKVLAPGFSGPIHMVFGNVEDRELVQKVAKDFKHVQHYGDVGEAEIGGKKMAFVHFPDSARKLAQSGAYNLVFYGHTHTPWEETIGKTRVVNPGTVAGLFTRATFAVYDTETGELTLKLVENV